MSFFKKLFNRIGGQKEDAKPPEEVVQEQLPAPEAVDEPQPVSEPQPASEPEPVSEPQSAR